MFSCRHVFLLELKDGSEIGHEDARLGTVYVFYRSDIIAFVSNNLNQSCRQKFGGSGADACYRIAIARLNPNRWWGAYLLPGAPNRQLQGIVRQIHTLH